MFDSKLFFEILYFHTIGVEITKMDVKFHTNFCYFRTNGTEITTCSVKITPAYFIAPHCSCLTLDFLHLLFCILLKMKT